MISQMKFHRFSNYGFYEDFDGNELTNDIIEKYCNLSFEEQYNRFKKWFPHAQPREMRLSDYSVTIKYIEVYKKIAEGNDPYALILEDDSILDTDFVLKFRKMYEETPKTYDMIFLGSGCNLHAENIVDGKSVYLKGHPAARCVSATVIKKETCQTLLETIIPFSLCIDWELNYQMDLHNHEVYWWEPPLVLQGSEIGVYKTSMR